MLNLERLARILYDYSCNIRAKGNETDIENLQFTVS